MGVSSQLGPPNNEVHLDDNRGKQTTQTQTGIGGRENLDEGECPFSLLKTCSASFEQPQVANWQMVTRVGNALNYLTPFTEFGGSPCSHLEEGPIYDVVLGVLQQGAILWECKRWRT